jgi:hypothetical protein
MSRIHEALKKAAQERSSHVAAGTVPDVADVAAGFESPSGDRMQVTELTVRSTRTSEGSSFLGFDGLLQRCGHPKWHLDSRMNVFLKTDEGRIGRERFRTLR